MTLTVTLLTSWGESERYELFLAHMRKCGDVETAVIHGTQLSLAPTKGFILYLGQLVAEALDDVDSSARAQLAARLLPFVHPGSWVIQQTIEPLKVAGAIDEFVMIRTDASDHVGALGLFGRKDLAPIIGATCERFPLPSEHYAYLGSDTHNGLPHLLVDYLRALQKLEGQ